MSNTADHADSSTVKVEQAKQSLAQILTHHKGRDNAVSSKQLAEGVGLKPTTVRDLIAEVRREFRLPIASCPQGYYVIESEEEFQKDMNRRKTTIETKKQRMKDQQLAWYDE